MNRGGVKDDPGSKMGKGPFTLGHRAVGSWDAQELEKGVGAHMVKVEQEGKEG